MGNQITRVLTILCILYGKVCFIYDSVSSERK